MLKLEFIKKPLGILLLFLAIPYGPMAIAISAAITSLFSLLVGAIACQKCVHYTLWQHFYDVMPIIVCTLLAGGTTWIVGLLSLPLLIKLLLQSIVMLGVYISITLYFKVPGHYYILGYMKNTLFNKFFKRRRNV